MSTGEALRPHSPPTFLSARRHHSLLTSQIQHAALFLYGRQILTSTGGFVGERPLDLTSRPLHGQKERMNSPHSAGFQSDVCSGTLQESEGHNGHPLIQEPFVESKVCSHDSEPSHTRRLKLQLTSGRQEVIDNKQANIK